MTSRRQTDSRRRVRNVISPDIVRGYVVDAQRMTGPIMAKVADASDDDTKPYVDVAIAMLGLAHRAIGRIATAPAPSPAIHLVATRILKAIEPLWRDPTVDALPLVSFTIATLRDLLLHEIERNPAPGVR